ncbi:hypothetical protein PB1_02575 [Bacillus methanolicus PB1]|uniref:Uncharacterized protein n=1 Tax=Bacillus methanolicus PB1 TaxID=997296 RepID=I3E5L7_BACMT|nr:hypothetical protein PB1_02575 [Bacillus methanolicus PB1]
MTFSNWTLLIINFIIPAFITFVIIYGLWKLVSYIIFRFNLLVNRIDRTEEYKYYETEIEFSKEQISEFLKKLENDPRWKNTTNN